jgi:hypothetical protein
MNKEQCKDPCKCSLCKTAANRAAAKREGEDSRTRITNLRRASAQIEAASVQANRILEAQALEQAQLRSKIAEAENQRDQYLEGRKKRSTN